MAVIYIQDLSGFLSVLHECKSRGEILFIANQDIQIENMKHVHVMNINIQKVPQLKSFLQVSNDIPCLVCLLPGGYPMLHESLRYYGPYQPDGIRWVNRVVQKYFLSIHDRLM
jgi:hypothetical protein